jgi:hypothetical protein
MVGATRGTPAGFRADQSSNSQQPSPLLPNLAKVLARQTELLNLLVQAQQNQQHQQSRGRDEPLVATYQDFLSTQPPLFSKAEEPLDADAWLRTIESKFALLTIPCADPNKAHFATQQLRGAARIWWDNFCAMQTNGHAISWEEFRNAFRAHHIPEGLMERKLNEFLALTQGTRTVLQYAQAFIHLCQYAGYYADNDAKKQDRFHRGLNTKLKEHLNLIKANTFGELVNMALTQEDCITAHRAEKKRRISIGSASLQPSQCQLVQNVSPRAPQSNALISKLAFRPLQQIGEYQPPVFLQQSQQTSPRSNVQQVQQKSNTYCSLKCGSADHLIRNCPQLKKSNQGQSSSQNDQKKGKRPMMQVRQGQINFTTLAELPDGAPIMSSTFLICHKPVVTLFDSGATHSFISNNCSTRIGLDPCPTQGSYMISTPGGEIASNQMIKGVPIQLGSKVIKTDLVLLNLEGIDVILGTNWMTEHRVLLDISSRVFEIDSPHQGATTLYLPQQEYLHSCTYAITDVKVKDIPVVCEYPDVFPDDLPGMPPDRDIEFIIELQPGTAPIFKRPYRMPPNELAELKFNFKIFLIKVLYAQVRHLGVVPLSSSKRRTIA